MALLKLKKLYIQQLADREDLDVLCLLETKLQDKDVEAIKESLHPYKNSFGRAVSLSLGLLVLQSSHGSLIRRHMVSDVSAESENKPANGAKDEETHQDGAKKSHSAESSDSCSDFAERELIPANEDAERQEIEPRKLFSIKLVRGAIEKNLLPEVEFDNQSVTSDSSANQKSFEMSHSQDIRPIDAILNAFATR